MSQARPERLGATTASGSTVYSASGPDSLPPVLGKLGGKVLFWGAPPGKFAWQFTTPSQAFGLQFPELETRHSQAGWLSPSVR
jgi:hypothetical protein